MRLNADRALVQNVPKSGSAPGHWCADVRADRESTMSDIGVVIIGRNEGARLVECLQELVRLDLPIVYVDSGSTDGSQQTAHDIGAQVVDLNLDQPFTAARARNRGFQRLCQQQPSIEFVQFLDGDCLLQ